MTDLHVALEYRPEWGDIAIDIAQAQAACDASVDSMFTHPAGFECFQQDLDWLMALIGERESARMKGR